MLLHSSRCHTAISSKLMLLHSRLVASSAAPQPSSSVATQQPQHPPSSRLVRPTSSPPLFQERINSDGSLTTGPQREQQWRQQQQHPPQQQPGTAPHTPSSPLSITTQQQQQQQDHAALPRPPGVPVAAPAAAPISQQQLEQLVDLLEAARRVVVVTGAGCSTESNIPDYRGPKGAYTTGFTPMTHQQFMSKTEARRRYWARSYAGWHEFAGVGTNPAHEGLARLQQRGWCDLVLTQNVDRLHHRAGSEQVLELHGTTHRVVCMDCGDNTCRHELQQRLSALNPALAERVAQLSSSGISSRGAWQRALRAGTAADARKVVQESREATGQVPLRRPDGDVELVDAGVGFQLAPCVSCGSELLKPDVVFFGDSVPKARVDSALAAMAVADLVLVVGSSLMVWSAFRLIKAAKEGGARLAIVNVGPTRADDLADLKVEALAGEVMMRLAAHPRLLLPRVATA